MAGPSRTVPEAPQRGEDGKNPAVRSPKSNQQDGGVKERDVFTVNSAQFKATFPNFDLASKFPAPTSTKKGFFRLLKEFRGGGKASEAPAGVPEPDKTHVIQFSDKNVLGEGACAVVVRAHLDGEPVAAKILKKPTKYKSDVYSYEEAKASLIKEIELLAGLNHSNVVGLLGVFYEADDIVMVQELMRCSLKEYVHTQAEQSGVSYWNTPPQMFLTWAHNMFDVLQFMHSRSPPVVHRDIKPDNLLIDQNMNIRLGDFGLSRLADPGSKAIQGRYCMTGCCGSLRYMAPEVQDDDDEGIALYNEKVDIYSASMVLYFIATGHPPFHRQTAECAAAASIRGGRPTLAEIQNRYDRFFLELIRSTWTHSTRRRPTATQVLSDINSFRNSSAGIMSRATRLLSPGRRPPSLEAPSSPTLSSASMSWAGDQSRQTRRRSISPTRWIGSVFTRASQSPVRGAARGGGNSPLDADSGTLTPTPSRPSIGARRISTNLSGIFFGGSRRQADGRKESISPMRYRRGSDVTQKLESSSGEGASSFFRNMSPSRLWRTADSYKRGDEAGNRSPRAPQSPVSAMMNPPRAKLCSHIGPDGQSDGPLNGGGDYLQLARQSSSFEDIDQINERAIAALGGEEEEPDIITPLGGRKSSSESYLAMPGIKHASPLGSAKAFAGSQGFGVSRGKSSPPGECDEVPV
mmetsp:Transcript_11660/g.29099  ORF Transcript_11660/g.29099 Transcript_11660/m.29099 type:complete len:690 (-) Transcript_11660:172-2241(-)